jgi:alkaline phosphatase/streptomycin-6-phosphatase
MAPVFVAAVLAASQRAPQPGAEDRTARVRASLGDGPARNVLLFIGDGMGDSEITLARNYAVGAAGRLALDTLPFTGAYTTFSVQESAPASPNYVPDSAATGTAWATGTKTSNGRISTSAGTDRDLKTILEYAQERGYRTGDVTTADLTDATPAVLAAHVASRTCMGPQDMAACPQDRKSAGGPGSIAEQLIAHKVDVLLGGGRTRFEQQTDAGLRVLDIATRGGYTIVMQAAELGRTAAGPPVLGLFAPGNMATEWTGLEALPYPSNVKQPQVCKEDLRPADQPSLAEMTAAALRLLDRPVTAGPGLFLQVEGASIDKQSHAADPCGQIGETVAFDRAVRVGLDFAETNPGTLLVVTADHGHAAQIVGLPSDADHPPGPISVLMTADRVPMTVSYGTNGYHGSQEHTGTQVRIAAAGPQAANVLGVTDQTDTFHLLLRAISIGAPSTSSLP